MKQKKYIGNDSAVFCNWFKCSIGTPWCAVFVSYCAAKSNTSIDKTGYVPDMANQFKNQGMYITSKKYIPKSGYLIFYDYEHDGRENHVGIVEKYENDIVYTIEGNWGSDDSFLSQVCRATHNINDSDIIGYGLTL